MKSMIPRRRSNGNGTSKKKISPNAEVLTATVTKTGKGRILAEAQRRTEEGPAHISIGVVINDWAMSLPPAPEEPQQTKAHLR